MKLSILIKRYFRKRRRCQKHSNRHGGNKKINEMVNFKGPKISQREQESMRGKEEFVV